MATDTHTHAEIPEILDRLDSIEAILKRREGMDRIMYSYLISLADWAGRFPEFKLITVDKIPDLG